MRKLIFLVIIISNTLLGCGNNKKVEQQSIDTDTTVIVKQPVYFSYCSACNIEIQIDETRVSINNNGKRIVDKQLFLKPVEGTQSEFNVVDEDNKEYFQLSIRDDRSIKIYSFEDIFSCEEYSKIIPLWTDIHLSENREDFVASIEATNHYDLFVLKAELLEKLQRFKDAEILYKKIIEIAPERYKQCESCFNNVDIKSLKLRLAELYKKVGDMEQSSFYERMYTEKSHENCLIKSHKILPYKELIDIDSVKYEILTCEIEGMDEFICGNSDASVRYIPLPNMNSIDLILVPVDCGDLIYNFYLLTIRDNKVIFSLYVEGEWYDPTVPNSKKETRFELTSDFRVIVLVKSLKELKQTIYQIQDDGKIVQIE